MGNMVCKQVYAACVCNVRHRNVTALGRKFYTVNVGGFARRLTGDGIIVIGYAVNFFAFIGNDTVGEAGKSRCENQQGGKGEKC